MKSRPETLDEYIIREQHLPVAREFFSRVRRDDKVFDIGANIGATADILTGLSSDVQAWEPEQDNFDLLVQNAPKAVSHRAAVIAGDNDFVEFFLNVGKNKGLHSAVPTRGRDVVRVPAVSVRSIMAEEPTVVKIDIEGGEYPILPEIVDTPSVRLIMLELHLTRKEWREREAPIALGFLAEYGFKTVYPPKVGEKNWATVGVFER
jgi:FkbM family methyltransferase